MKDFEKIMAEVQAFQHENDVKMYDGIPANPDVQAIDTEYERATLWNETDIRNDILKSVALAFVTGACAYFKLMHAALYIPIVAGCLCNVCYKYGVFRGRNDE